jgi:hypothetical protein
MGMEGVLLIYVSPQKISQTQTPLVHSLLAQFWLQTVRRQIHLELYVQANVTGAGQIGPLLSAQRSSHLSAILLINIVQL